MIKENSLSLLRIRLFQSICSQTEAGQPAHSNFSPFRLWLGWAKSLNFIGRIYTSRRLRRPDALNVWPGLLEAWLVLTSVKYHGNLYILIPLNQRLALTRLRATGPWLLSASRFYTRRLKRLRRLIHLLSASIGSVYLQTFQARSWGLRRGVLTDTNIS